MRLKLFVILSLFLISGINCLCQEKGQDSIMMEYANNRRPMFDGDMSLKKLDSWVEKHLRYPKDCKRGGIQGRVTIGFTITKEGKLADVKVLKGVHPLLDSEAVRVINTTADKWTCGYNSFNGEACDVRMVYSVIFSLKQPL